MSSETDRLDALLNERAARLRQHEGLSQRVFELSVSHLSPAVVGSVGPELELDRVAPGHAWRRHLAMAASVAVAACLVGTFVFISSKPSSIPVAQPEIALNYPPSDEVLIAILAGSPSADFGSQDAGAVDGLLTTRDTAYTDFAGEVQLIVAAAMPSGGR
ncbi:MAG: hypothetical protein EXS00_08675 [Phycisphaerales bacterium]|nr:hypothetical protein [Phycisphaerales bacterium]